MALPRAENFGGEPRESPEWGKVKTSFMIQRTLREGAVALPVGNVGRVSLFNRVQREFAFDLSLELPGTSSHTIATTKLLINHTG
jgi:hypothetical protein